MAACMRIMKIFIPAMEVHTCNGMRMQELPGACWCNCGRVVSIILSDGERNLTLTTRKAVHMAAVDMVEHEHTKHKGTLQLH